MNGQTGRCPCRALRDIAQEKGHNMVHMLLLSHPFIEGRERELITIVNL
jgi:hypothetical protein